MASSSSDFARQRRELVDRELRLEGIRDEAVLQAICSVPREEFLPTNLREFAYGNVALPIEGGQTISQPYIVALMAEALELNQCDTVLEIGAGSGYAAAVLSKLANEVFAIERVEELALIAARRLRRLGFDNVHVQHGDGTRGCPEHAPFEAISVAAGGSAVPKALLVQLADGGRLVMPVGQERSSQMLIRVIRRGKGDYSRKDLGPVRFVPLIGDVDAEGDDIS